ncbi:MAG: ABC transporter substrate-binding protein [Candidatus Gracilibacteria bacterium]|nr:ABC transporter substrate-binding protein [Candidatus Gracilibacteria bacterium]
MKKIFSVLMMSLFVLTACGEVSPDGRPETASPENPFGGEVIRMGYIGPLTGDAASLGQDEKATLEMWLEQNPEIDGKKVEIVYEDGKCNGQEAASAAQKLIAINKVQVLLGGLCSGETLGIAPIAEQEKVLAFSSFSTSPEITDAGDYVFRNAPSDANSSTVLVDLVDQYSKIALISQNNDYSAAYRKALQDKLPGAGVELVVDEAFNSGTTDFKTILQKVKDSEAEALVLIPGEVSPGGFIVKQAAELGVELPMFGGDVLSGTEFFDIGKDATEGIKIVIMAADESDSVVKKFIDDFVARNNREPSATAFMLLNWDKMNILKQAITEVGYDASALKDYLYAMEGFEGIGGLSKFDKNGDVSLTPGVMIAKDGSFVLLSEDDENIVESEESEDEEGFDE